MSNLRKVRRTLSPSHAPSPPLIVILLHLLISFPLIYDVDICNIIYNI